MRRNAHERATSKENCGVCNETHWESIVKGNRKIGRGKGGKRKSSRRNIIAVVPVSWDQVHCLEPIRKETHPNHVRSEKFATPRALNMQFIAHESFLPWVHSKDAFSRDLFAMNNALRCSKVRVKRNKKIDWASHKVINFCRSRIVIQHACIVQDTQHYIYSN